jgi:hypothetical protein
MRGMEAPATKNEVATRGERTGSSLRTQTQYKRTLGEEPAGPSLTAGSHFQPWRISPDTAGLVLSGLTPMAAAPQRA